MYKFVVHLFLLNFLLNFVISEHGSFTQKERRGRRRFTHEWQEIDNDEPVPAGMHIRINLATGKKEVKLLDKEESTSTSVAVAVDDAVFAVDELSDLRERLKNIPAESPSPTPEEVENVQKKFRPYEELKKEFETLRLTVKTDLELMDELFANYQKVMEKHKKQSMQEFGKLNILLPMEEAHLSILTDLEYMVHQVDNARKFVHSGGLIMIVYPSLNSSSSVIRTEAARLLGSAVQNDAASQIKAVESGAVDTLLRVLALDSAASVRSAALYGLSCLIRRFPLAQRQFTDQGGLTVLASLFDGDSSEHLKLQVKVVTLVDDMMTEREDAEISKLMMAEDNGTQLQKDEARERLRQYRLIDLQHILHEHQWCQHLVKLFKRELLTKSALNTNKVFDEHTDHTPDLDVVEKLTKAMASLAKPCHKQFLADKHIEKLVLGLIRWLKQLSDKEKKERDADKYYSDLADQVKILGSRFGVFHTTHTLPNLL